MRDKLRVFEIAQQRIFGTEYQINSTKGGL